MLGFVKRRFPLIIVLPVQAVVAEVVLICRNFSSAAPFSSPVGLCLINDISGGKVLWKEPER